MANEEPTVFPHKIDRYGGAIVSSISLSPFSSPSSTPLFTQHLSFSISHWEKEGVKGVWIQTNPSEHAHLLTVLLANSFSFHHANPQSAVLNRWLPPTPSRLPRFATHYVGAGGLVFHPSKPYTVLVISESHEKTVRLKVPGGLVDSGESIVEGAMREVREETGVECDDRDITLLCLRDRQDALFDCSDFYMVVAMTAKTTEITPCALEVTLAEWMDLREVLKNEYIYPFNRAMFKSALQIAEERERKKEGKEEEEGKGGEKKLGFGMTPFPGFRGPNNPHNVYACKVCVENFVEQSTVKKV